MALQEALQFSGGNGGISTGDVDTGLGGVLWEDDENSGASALQEEKELLDGGGVDGSHPTSNELREILSSRAGARRPRWR
jgi:hypothetical protein